MKVSPFIVLAPSALLGATIPVRAQESPPYVYLWDAPDGGWEGLLEGRASQIVRVKLGDYESADEVAEAIIGAAVEQIESGLTAPDRICILLQHFGEDWVLGTGNEGASFYHVDDKPDPPPGNWPPNTPEDVKWMNPWMNHARPLAKAWMEEFIEWYKAYAAAAELEYDPIRFAFDSEVKQAGCCSLYFTSQFRAVVEDDRWFTEEVPGSDGMLGVFEGDKTMAGLWADAVDEFGWDANPVNAIEWDEEPNDELNRKYFLWYYEICQRAVDAAMKETAYDVIHRSTTGTPPGFGTGCKVSNYGDFNADGKLDRFGWYTGRHHESTGEAQLDARYLAARGATNFYETGSKHYWNDYTISDDHRSLWLTSPGVSSGDFSAPALYQYSEHHNASGRLNYYLPPDFYPYQQTDPSMIMLQNGRRWIESILNSPGGDPSKVVPWIGAISNEVPWTTYDATIEDLRDALALLARAKRIGEIIVWWPNEQYTYWDDIHDVFDWVYTPQIESCALVTGSCYPSCPMEPDRIRYTVREEDPDDDVIEIISTPVGNNWLVELKVTYDHLDEFPTQGMALLLNLECAVDPYEGDADDIRGDILVWHPTGGQGGTGAWMEMPIDDFTSAGDKGFGFFAPSYPDDEDFDWFETRRQFDVEPLGVDDGDVEVKLVLRRPYTDGDHHFRARFDLAQLIEWPAEATESSVAQGADFDHSKEVTPGDFASFLSAYALGKPSADFNNDGQLTTDDMIGFGAAYNGPP